MKFLALDIETTGLEYSAEILSVGVAYRGDDGEIITEAWPFMAHDLFHTGLTTPQLRAKLIPLINNADIVFGHNFAFDLSVLFKYGIVLDKEIKRKSFCTMLSARMSAAYDRVSLAAIAAKFGIGDIQWYEAKKNRKNLKRIDVGSLLEYQKKDCRYQLLTGECVYAQALQIYTHDYMMDENDFCRVVAKMRVNGLPLDREKTEERIYSNREKMKLLHNTILYPNRIENVNSHKEIVSYFKRKGIGAVAWTKTGEQWDKNALKTVLTRCDDDAANVIKALLACKKMDKENNTWLGPFLDYAKEDGRVHANYSVAGAVSYRLTCNYPGLQAVPWMDIWEPYLVCDYSQAEMRFATLYAGFKELAVGFQIGLDAHTNTATRILKRDSITEDERKLYGKTVNFAALYCAGDGRLAGNTGKPIEEIHALRKLMLKEMGPLFTTGRKVNKVWTDRGYITLWDGSRIYKRGFDVDYKGFNQLCQGGVAKLSKNAMMRLDEKGIPIWGQVHDSNYFPPWCDRDEIVDIMATTLPAKISNATNPPVLMKVDAKMKPHEMTDAELEALADDGDEYTDDESPEPDDDTMVPFSLQVA